MAHAMDLFKLNGKVALVTGGGKGLGFFAAQGMAEAGADVAICGRNVSGNLDEAVAALAKTGRNCIGIDCFVEFEPGHQDVAVVGSPTHIRHVAPEALATGDRVHHVLAVGHVTA